ncbi:unnamed protein product, partial [Prorocentrum cordatum]
AKVVPNAPRGDSLEVGLTGSVEFFELSDEVDEENAKSEDALDEWYSKDVDLVQDEGDAELGARLEEQLGLHSDEEKLAKSVGDPSMLGVPALSSNHVGGWIEKAAKLPAVPRFPLLVEDKWQRLCSENAAVYAKMERVQAGRRLANDIMVGIIREKGTKEEFLEEVEFPSVSLAAVASSSDAKPCAARIDRLGEIWQVLDEVRNDTMAGRIDGSDGFLAWLEDCLADVEDAAMGGDEEKAATG